MNNAGYAAFYQDNESLVAYLNAQQLGSPVVCLGDGHNGVWKRFGEIATATDRCEILDWYHLKEPLYKVGGSLKRLAAAAALLWHGQVEAAKVLFAPCRRKHASHLEAYRTLHRTLLGH